MRPLWTAVLGMAVLMPLAVEAKAATAPAEKPAATAKPSSQAGSHTVVAGDSLEKIARRTGTTAAALAKMNGIKGDVIKTGQVLKVPSAKPAAPAPAVAKTTPAAPAKAAAPAPAVAKVSKKPEPAPVVKSKPVPAVAKVEAAPEKPASVAQKPAPALPKPATETVSNTKKAPAVSREPVLEPSVRESAPAPAPKPAATASRTPETSSTPEQTAQTVSIDTEMTYGEFASKHGTDAERLNALNGLDLSTATVLAKGSELYVPAQP